MKKTIILIMILGIMVCMVCGCDQTDLQEIVVSESGTYPAGDETESNTVLSGETELTKEPEGYYTLEKCLTWGGVFISYNDGSFDSYIDGGYCDVENGAINGMYLPNRIAQRVPVIDGDTNVVIFADSDYRLELYPINAEVSVIQMRHDDGYEGYGRLDGLIETASIRVVYINGEWERIYPDYINGEPSADYDAEIIEWNVTPFKGMSSTVYTNRLLGFQVGEKVTLGIVQGTRLNETEYTADATYFDCKLDHNNWQDEDVYYPNIQLTNEGYANVDFSDIPDGRYVMVYWSSASNGKMSYNASLLILER